MRLDGKSAIVTGGGYGNGRGIARRFAEEGAFVVVADAVDRRGRLDVMVANAGINAHAGFLDLTDEQWERVLAVNLNGAFYCGQAAARAMARTGGGSIVNVTSIFSLVTGPGTANYSASKGGVRQLTRAMALDLAEHAIRVNAVSPGAIRTRMSEDLLADEAGLRRFLGSIPLGRIGEPGDIAAAALFLASDESAYVTGIELIVDGGWTLRAGAGPGGIVPSETIVHDAHAAR